VLSLAGIDHELLMEGESQVWTSNDVIIVLQHENNQIPLRWVFNGSYSFMLMVLYPHKFVLSIF
jgi:hypothetical protein